MKRLYLISQGENSVYDTFDSAVVCAESEEAARLITPDGKPFAAVYSAWASSPEHVTVRLLGDAADDVEEGVVLASFNAG